MEITVRDEIEQIKKLISYLQEYCLDLKSTVIDGPSIELYDAKSHGLPEEYYYHYKKIYDQNVLLAEHMIRKIADEHIPFWEGVIRKLEERL